MEAAAQQRLVRSREAGAHAPAREVAVGEGARRAAPPRREGPVYAFLRDGWNGALDGARKAIGDIFAP